MDGSASIPTSEHYITFDGKLSGVNLRDSVVDGIFLTGNHKINFLPFRLSHTYPNLLMIEAEDCQILSISAETFAGLTKVQGIHLNKNLITVIPFHVFEGLNNLKVVDLGKILR